MTRVAQITLHPTLWKSEEDFFDEVLRNLDAPDWHGKNYDALSDSLVTGQVNGVEPPIKFVIEETQTLPQIAAHALAELESIAAEARSNGRIVEVVRA
jgi:RNAse (barnase) inhibitor barstar